MIAIDEDALICDLAETYHIYDYRSLPVELVATFSCGLRDDSRIKMKIRGVTTSETNLLIATVADRIYDVAYARCGKENNERIIETYFVAEKKESDIVVFETADDFERARSEYFKD